MKRLWDVIAWLFSNDMTKEYPSRPLGSCKILKLFIPRPSKPYQPERAKEQESMSDTVLACRTAAFGAVVSRYASGEMMIIGFKDVPVHWTFGRLLCVRPHVSAYIEAPKKKCDASATSPPVRIVVRLGTNDTRCPQCLSERCGTNCITRKSKTWTSPLKSRE